MSKEVEPRRTDIFTFINEKLLIEDVEPMYVAIVRANLPLRIGQRLCMSEGLADHLGLAAKMSQEKDYWAAAMAFVKQGLRGGARRHFRAKVAVEAIEELSDQFTPLERFFEALPRDYHQAREYITGLPQFGPFSAFKIADMAERTCGNEVDFSKVGIDGLAKFPRRGLALAAEYLGTKNQKQLLADLLGHKWKRLAPPHYDRPMNIQEIETCLCNYGHSKWHEPGYEGRELRKLLDGFGWLASKIKANLPRGGV